MTRHHGMRDLIERVIGAGAQAAENQRNPRAAEMLENGDGSANGRGAERRLGVQGVWRFDAASIRARTPYEPSPPGERAPGAPPVDRAATARCAAAQLAAEIEDGRIEPVAQGFQHPLRSGLFRPSLRDPI
jgi:hypothetical protein